MANWMTAEEIGERYVVGPERLQAYAARGNLPCRRPADGPMLFDEAGVARLFRPRHGGIVVLKAPAGAHLGVLGLTKLGDEASSNAAFGRGVRKRRVTHSDVVPSFPGALENDVVIPRLRKRG